MPKIVEWKSLRVWLPPSSTKPYSRIIEKWLKFEEKYKRLVDIISDPSDIISPFFICQHLSLFQIYAGGSTLWLYQVTNLFQSFSCFPYLRFLSLDTGIPILRPAAWCNYVCKSLFLPSQSARVGPPLGTELRWRSLNIENVISNDSFHCPPSYPSSAWCLCQPSGPMNNNKFDKAFHQYTFPSHWYFFHVCLNNLLPPVIFTSMNPDTA